VRERIADARIWLIRHTPAGLLWHPFEWFIATLCVSSGIAALFGDLEPNSVRDLLPAPFLMAWGVMLVVGAVALASGLSSIRAVSADRYVVTRVPAYRLGLRLLALVTSVYMGAVLLYAGLVAVGACIIPLAFVLSCGVRLLSLGGRR
jgi:hypothetical protein